MAANTPLEAVNAFVDAMNRGDIISSWSMTGRDPSGSDVDLSGQSTDVLRRMPDGEWKIAIDNPWGSAVLGISS